MNWYVHDKGLQAAENLKSYNGSGIITEKGRSMDKKAERAKIKLSELKQNNNTYHIWGSEIICHILKTKRTNWFNYYLYLTYYIRCIIIPFNN